MNMLLCRLNRLLAFPRLLRVCNKPSMSTVATRIIATLVLTAIMGVQLPAQQNVPEVNYEFLYRQTAAKLERLTLQMAKKTLGDDDRKKMIELQLDQTENLEKLISLNPENEGYRYELAKLVSARGDRPRALKILNELAPEDAPGYPEAHFVLANQYFEKPAASFEENTKDLNVALKHVNHVLTRDSRNLDSMLLKARILTRLQKYEGAYELYEDLMEVNPNYYREMAILNTSMGREERNQSVYEKALANFESLAEKRENQTDDRKWIVIEAGVGDVLRKLDRYEEAEARHEEMIAQYASDPKGGPRRVFLQRLLAETYISWAGNVADQKASFDSLPPETLETMLNLYAKAYMNHERNPVVLQSLARLSFSSNAEIAAKAREVYDANADIDAPAAVLNQLGNHALLSEKFSEAIRSYERAREKSPRDPSVLNNLSYAYLVAVDERNAKRALELIDEALKILPIGINAVEQSKFLHTKATALKQLEQFDEAIELYERGIKLRPNHADTLRALIECYRALNKNPPEEYVSRLEEIDNQK